MGLIEKKRKGMVVFLFVGLIIGSIFYGLASHSTNGDVYALSSSGGGPSLEGGRVCTGNSQVGVADGSGSTCAKAVSEASAVAWSECKEALASKPPTCTPSDECKPSKVPPVPTAPPSFNCTLINGVWTATVAIQCQTVCISVKIEPKSPESGAPVSGQSGGVTP
jgi:hypothetical protein